jgi:hypothetical protein
MLMFLTDSEIRERFGTMRPGRELIAVEDAAIPVSVLSTQVLAQEEKGLPLLDEFVLRSSQEGLSKTDEVAALLGIDPGMLENVVAGQYAIGNLDYRPSTGIFALTPRGEVAARELTLIAPVEQELPVVFDRMIWRVGDYREYDLITKKEAENNGMILLPAKNTKRILKGDIRPRDIEALIDSGRGASRKLQILEVMRVRPSKHLYLPVKLLIFSDGVVSVPELMLLVDGEDSPIHESLLESVGGPMTLGMQVRPAESVSISTAAASDPRAASPSQFGPALTGLDKDALSPANGSVADQVTQIPVFDHPIHLKNALRSARKRILLISPWVKNAVVNTNFVSDLERRLRAGVVVHIGHGYGESDEGSDDAAVRKLRNLQSRYPDKFKLVRLPNTHAKILVYDDTYITTSFNWLSFKGDQERTYRMEEGTLVRGAILAEKTYSKYVLELESHLRP